MLKVRPIKKKSTFLVTINTNVKVRGKDLSELSDILRATLNELFTPSNLVPRVKFVAGEQRDVSRIKSADVKFAIERGTNPRGGRLHAHCLVAIKHLSKIQLDGPGIKEFVMEDMNPRLAKAGFPELKSVYVNIRHVPNQYNVLRYLKKTGKANKIPKAELAIFEDQKKQK
jgi:hypothetical protein